MHRKHVDDVGPVVAPLVAVAHQLGGDRVAVGLVADENVAEVIAEGRAQSHQERAEVGLPVDHASMPLVKTEASRTLSGLAAIGTRSLLANVPHASTSQN